MSATTAALFQVGTAATVAGGGIAAIAYATGVAKVVLIATAWIFGVVVFAALFFVTIPIAWNVLYRKPPRPHRARHTIRKAATSDH